MKIKVELEEKYIVKTQEELELMTNAELIDYVIEGEARKKTIKINRIQVPWEYRLETGLTLKNEGVTLLYDLSDKGSGSFNFPYMDERKHPYYFDNRRNAIRTFQGKKKMTPKKYFRLIDTYLDEDIFGTSTTETVCALVPLKQNDYRYADVVKDGRIDGAIDKKYFYYDYENGFFVQVNRDKYVDNRTGEIKTDKDGNPLDEKTEELLRREELARYVMGRFMELEEKFVFYFDRKWTQLKMVDLTGTAEVQEFYKVYKRLLKRASQNLKVKLVLSLVDSDEYSELRLAVKNSLERVEEEEDKRRKILEQLGVSDYKFTDRQYNTLESSIDYVKRLGTFSEKSSSGFLKTLVSILIPKPEFKDMKDEKYTFDGYLDESDSKVKLDRLYPNLSTINTRYFFTEHQDSDDKRKSYEERLLTVLNSRIVDGDTSNRKKPKTVENMPIYMQIYTEYELSEMAKDWKVSNVNRSRIRSGYLKELKQYPNIKQGSHSVLIEQFNSFMDRKR